MVSSQYDSIFLSYTQILERLKIYGIKTKHGKEITFMDLVKEIKKISKRALTNQKIYVMISLIINYLSIYTKNY